MRLLLLVTAGIEIATGLALLARPASAVAALLGLPAPAPEALFVGRLAGAALLAIGVACAIAATDRGGRALAGVLAGVLVYDVGATALFAGTGAAQTMSGPALWPAAALHAALAVWAAVCLRGAVAGGQAPA